MKQPNTDKSAMERDWDARARHSAVRYVAGESLDDAFFEDGARQAHEFCSGFFQREGFQPKGKRMLDIGCGLGRMERGFSQMFGEVWGLDVSGEMIAQATQLNEAFQNVKFVKGNGIDLSLFLDEYFDFVFSYITFQHIPEKNIILSYLSEIQRVLKPGGLFKILLRRPWSGVAFAFGFIPVPRFVFPYVPQAIWTMYERLATTEEERLRRGNTYRGCAMSEKETIQILLQLQFKGIGIEPDPSRVVFWCYGRKMMAGEGRGSRPIIEERIC
jgi:SAM-dependent methyltransferase